MSQSDGERSSRDLAAEMHAQSVHLWNALWREDGESMTFQERARIERIQGDLSVLAWPEAR